MSLIVYLIDDDEVFNTLNAAIIEFVDPAIHVRVFKSGEEVMEYLNANQETQAPDLVFLDIRMPNMDGFELLDTIVSMAKNPFANSKVYMLSSTLNEKDLNRTRQYPIISSFLGKPLTVELFREITDSLNIGH
jgi:CheY-like chemotaxis protein